MQLITLCSFGNDSPETASAQKCLITYYCIQLQDLSLRESSFLILLTVCQNYFRAYSV
jgi:hypothetical protein